MDNIVCFFIGVIFSLILMIPVVDSKFESGQISVSSGQSVCKLVENQDKTTHWACAFVNK